MKKIITLLALLMLITLAGCSKTGENTDDVIQNEIEAETETTDNTLDLTWLENDNMAMVSGLYVVGEDIAGDSYIYLAQGDYGSEITIFETMDAYTAYFRMERFTNGEEDAAIAEHVRSHAWVYSDDEYALNLHDGNVLVVDGEGTLGDGVAQNLDSGKKFVEGIYLPGDFKEGKYIFSAMTEDSNEIVVFDTKDNYEAFVDSKPVTNGDFSRAVEANAKYYKWLSEGESVYIHLEEDDVIAIGYSGKLLATPVIMGYSK